jgi:hypothetical protein
MFDRSLWTDLSSGLLGIRLFLGSRVEVILVVLGPEVLVEKV